MQSTFYGEVEKQQRINAYLSRKLHHSRFRWTKIFPSNPANVSPAVFHGEADHKGWSAVVGIVSDGSVIGGLTSVGWTSAPNPTTLSDPLAFLFSFPVDRTEVFFPATAGQIAQVTHNANEGPCFGNKELYFSLGAGHAGSECNALVNYTVEGNVTNGVGVVADPQNPTTVWTPGAGNKQLITVEVYQIVPAEYALLPKQINNRSLIAMLSNQLVDLKNLGLKRLNICLVGDAKAGKSTAVNNFLSTLSTGQRLQTHAYGTNLNEPGTVCYHKYPLSLVGDVLEDLQHLPISVNDTPGFTDKYIDKIETLIPFIAQARVPEGWNVLNNPAFLPPSEDTAVHDWIHLFVIIIPADAINNPVKMEHFRRIERAIRTEPPNVLSYPKYPNVVYFVTQMDEPSRGGDVLLSSHPHQFEASELWATYKKKLKSPAGLGNADAFPIINLTEQFKEIPETHLTLFLEAWLRILAAVRTNVSKWMLQ